MTRKQEVTQIEKALADDYGHLGRRYAADTLVVPPKIWIDGERLCWAFGKKLTAMDVHRLLDRARLKRAQRDAVRHVWKARRILPGPRLLHEFLALADAPAAQVARFARKCGVLGICPTHGEPVSHAMKREWPAQAKGVCKPCGWDGQGGWELLPVWNSYAAKARALLTVASRLRGDLRRDPVFTLEELKPLHRDLLLVLDVANRLGSGGKGHRRRLKVQTIDMWQLLGDVVNSWLEIGDVRPRVLVEGAPESGQARIVIAPQWRAMEPEFPLFGTLAMQLAFAVSSARGIAFCSACGGSFEPGYQLRLGVDHYCGPCGRPAMLRAGSRRYREKRRRENS